MEVGVLYWFERHVLDSDTSLNLKTYPNAEGFPMDGELHDLLLSVWIRVKMLPLWDSIIWFSEAAQMNNVSVDFFMNRSHRQGCNLPGGGQNAPQAPKLFSLCSTSYNKKMERNVLHHLSLGIVTLEQPAVFYHPNTAYSYSKLQADSCRFPSFKA